MTKQRRKTRDKHASETANRPPWWKGARGEWLVVIQVILMTLVAFGPRGVPGVLDVAFPYSNASRILGLLLMVVGAALVVATAIRLGRRLSALPYPVAEARLIQSGPFSLARHPMYGGSLFLGLGWALLVQGWATLLLAMLLFVFLDFKSRREERWLVERFPAYRVYQRRVRRLIPFLY